MSDFEELDRRMSNWVSGSGAQLCELLQSVGSRNCGLSADDSAGAAIATIQRFVYEAGRTPDPANDFRQLMEIFKEELISRVSSLDPSLIHRLYGRVDVAWVRKVLDAFPGGHAANHPDTPSEEWRNAVLAALSEVTDSDGRSPWVHPDAEDELPPVSFLVDRLFDADPQVRQAAAEALSRHGQDALEALDALTEALGDPDPEVRAAVRAVIEALTK
jgi:hypothetical protein